MRALIPAAALALAATPAAGSAQELAHEHAAAEHGHEQATSSGRTVPLYDGLGSHHMEVATEEPLAQRYFDQGLALAYGFNHAEAIRSFQAAAELDPACALCQWGIAFALGPNINGGMDRESGLAAYHAIARALDLAGSASPFELGLIEALARRYDADPPAEREALDQAYASALEELAARFPADANVAVLAADALMNLTPWDYWVDGETLRPHTARARTLLERAMEQDPQNAGACHMYVHLMEERQPDRAVACAEKLPSLMPGVGHIVHMPGHIYIRVGRYVDAMEANIHAVHADEAVLPDQSSDGVYALAYYPHNYHFLWFAASMAGAGDRAIEAARKTADNVNRDLMRKPGMEALQHYLVTPLYALVRFGRWRDVLAEPAPPSDLVYPTGVWRYARALAYTALDDLEAAERELEALRELARDPALADQLIWDLNPMSAVLEIATDVVEGEMGARRGDFDVAVKRLEDAVSVETALLYDEPPTWHLPVRHNLGAILLEAGRAADAERVYRANLEVFRENGWALAGLRDALLAQGKEDDAAAVEARLAVAWREADVDVTGSRFAR